MTPQELKALRLSKGFSQGQLAALLKLKRGRTTISEWENGKEVIGPGYALAIRLMLGVEPPYKAVEK